VDSKFSSKMKIAVLNNYLGNIQSVLNILDYLKIDYIFTNKKKEISKSNAIIFPGVGSFPQAMRNLQKLNLENFLKDQLLVKKKPYLGICLGMQILLSKSYEIQETAGLNIIKGEVKKIRKSKNFSIPHVGWSKINILKKNLIFKKISNFSELYFDHSFFTDINNKKLAITKTKYSQNFISSFNFKNIIGVQFHPEKSQEKGKTIISNFLEFSKNYNT